MKLSLRVRALLLVASINVAVFAAGGLFLTRRAALLYEEQDQRMREQMEFLPRVALRPSGDVNVARILRWPGWALWRDAILTDANLVERADGSLQPRGVALNPLGSAQRGADFDEQAVLAGIGRALASGRPVTGVAGGRVFPIDGDGGRWGGVWYRAPGVPGAAAMFWQLFPWFVASTLLLTTATFVGLRRQVLAPLEQLAAGARRVQAGDLATRLVEPARRDEIADLVRSFNAMTETLQRFNERLAEEVQRATEAARRAEEAAMTQRRLAAMGELAAGIAHEINNPLGGLQNAVEALARADLPEERRKRYIGLLRSGLERIGETVGKLLRFTPRGASPMPVDLDEVARDALDLVRHQAGRRGVQVRLRLDATGAQARIEGERNELGQAVLNLLVNALDAFDQREPARLSREPPWVELALARRAGELVLSVTDNGPGVQEGRLGRVSDLFYSTKEVGKGSGLGLSIVQNAVARHRGRVLLSSEPGRGFRAELCFPLDPPVAETRPS